MDRWNSEWTKTQVEYYKLKAQQVKKKKELNQKLPQYWTEVRAARLMGKQTNYDIHP